MTEEEKSEPKFFKFEECIFNCYSYLFIRTEEKQKVENNEGVSYNIVIQSGRAEATFEYPTDESRERKLKIIEQAMESAGVQIIKLRNE